MSAAVPRELANRDVVMAELGVLRALLRGGGAGKDGGGAGKDGGGAGKDGGGAGKDGGGAGPETDAARTALEAARGRLARPSTLDELAGGFGLTPFERSVLLLAAGPELVAAVAEELTAATGLPRLTFGTALAVLPEAHWSALTPPGPLRRWSLVRLLDASSPTRSPLLVDERVLHHLAGAGHLDEYLAALSRPLAAPGPLPATLARCADAVAAAWRLGRAAWVHGPQPANVEAVVAAAADRAGLHAVAIQARDLPGEPLERDGLVRRMERETVLGGLAWVVELSGARPDEAARLGRSLLGFDGPLAVLAGGGAGPSPEAGPSDAVDVPVERLTLAERRETLRMTLRQNGCRTSPAETDLAAGVFDLSLESAGIVGREVAAGERLWMACRRRTRAGLGDLAAVVVPRARWDDLVLPGPVLAQLRALAAAVRHRTTVLDDWGFAARTSRGLGSTALFAGPSGTGKTMAAEVIARDLDLDLVHVDLSQVVSKWVGETEKHLRRVFDAAEDGGSVLLFDEADALFGKRSPVRDSHDRYANLEVGYLLQRMESFHGLAILTTNARSALDPAFTRRLRSIITFPYPDPALREAMWRLAFPAATPVSGLDRGRLAAVDVPGGGIAAIALTAAYLGAGEGQVTGDHVRTAARWELAKSGRAIMDQSRTDARPG